MQYCFLVSVQFIVNRLRSDTFSAVGITSILHTPTHRVKIGPFRLQLYLRMCLCLGQKSCLVYTQVKRLHSELGAGMSMESLQSVSYR